MKLFDIVNGTVVLNPNSLVIPEFKKIWDRDKSKTKEQATKEISYIVFLCDFNSPYNSFRENDRDKVVKQDFLKDESWEPDTLIVEGIKKYKLLQETPLLNMLRAAMNVVNKTTDYFNKVDYDEVDDRGKVKYTVSEVFKAMANMGGAINQLRMLEREVQREQIEASTSKGNNIIGDYELPR